MSGIPDWAPPRTWHVGDEINADNWTERVYNPLQLLLHRPITVAHKSVDTTVSAGGAQNPFAFDTLDADDDGMLIDDGAVTFTDFVAQRDGIYSVFASLTYIGNNAGDSTCVCGIFVNGNQIYKREGAVVGTTVGQDHFRSANGDVSLTEGDVVNVYAWNNTTAAITVQATLNAPRVVIMWKRPFMQ